MKGLLVFLLVLGLCGMAAAGEMAEVELTDGSVLHAEVLSYSGGVYQLRSGTLGLMHVDSSRIRSIHYGPPQGSAPRPPAAGGAPPLQDQVTALKDQMTSDQAIMDIVQGLQNDPQFREVMRDPAIMEAVNSGDMAALMANPKFLQLLQRPEVQEIGKRMGQ